MPKDYLTALSDHAIWPLLCTWHIRKTDGNSVGWSTMAYMFNLFGRYNRYGENIQ
jgi:hypothetical protein